MYAFEFRHRSSGLYQFANCLSIADHTIVQCTFRGRQNNAVHDLSDLIAECEYRFVSAELDNQLQVADFSFAHVSFLL